MDNLIKHFNPFLEINCILDVVKYSMNENVDSKSIAIDAMRVIKKDQDSDYFQVEINEEIASQMVGKVISFQDLWGEAFDIKNDQLNLFSYSLKCISCLVNNGLAYAFLAPVYDLSIDNPYKPFTDEYEDYGNFEKNRMLELIHKFCFEVLELNNLEEGRNLVIEKWPTNWSNYFDAGNEWWGAYYWTIQNPMKKIILVIAASDTD